MPLGERTTACERCFRDPTLKEWIRANGARRPCSWCGSKRAYAVPLQALGPLFRDVVRDVYVQADWRGDSIGFLLQGDWQVFSDRIEADTELRDQLAVAILKAGLHPKDDVDEPDYSGLFERPDSRLDEEWRTVLEEALATPEETAHGAIEPDTRPDDRLRFDRLEVALEDLATELPAGQVLYRARIHEERRRVEWFGLAELAAPPPERAVASRANRAGQPVLYLASDADTALAEVRAWVGAAVAIARVRTNRLLSLVDLRQNAAPTSPFFQEYLGWRLELAVLMRGLGEELSRPLLPIEQPKLYRASQHFCQIVRRARYDGLVYPSAMGDGFNVVLFDPAAGTPFERYYVRVVGVRHVVEELGEAEPPYEELPYPYHP